MIIDRTPTHVLWKQFQGDDWDETFTITDDDAPTYTPINITGDTFVMKVVATKGDPTSTVATLACTILNGAAGIAHAYLAAATTAGVEPGRYWAEFQRTTDGAVRTLVAGPWIVEAQSE